MFSRGYHIKLEHTTSSKLSRLIIMAGNSVSMRSRKPRLWRKCLRQCREKKTRFYIIWRCTVILLRWEDRF
ncbi:hypothetical protein L6164_025589 [Bauhinia variegata]|uniref:Uncharacterized protein n=1 Tax=Bauhinia variegata TaxID=167791 RepID=A0ACB9M0X7_BAUVA|nr:hypothetical protein L6164_025589 [Bauhinia variegata]